MNDYMQAADDARRLLRGFAAVQEVADAFDQVGGLQQAQAEAEAALEKLHAQHLAVSGEIAEAREQLAEAINSAAAIQDEAKRVMRDAQDEAAGVLERATEQANLLRQETSEWITAERAKLTESIDASCAQYNAIAAEVAELEVRAGEARTYLAKLAGG